MSVLRRGLLYGVVVVIGCAGSPDPAGAEVLTLADAVGRALQSGPDAVIARLEAERAERTASETRSSYFPWLGLTSQAGYSSQQDEKLRAIDARGIERRYGLTSLASDRGWLNLFLRQPVLDLRVWREIRRSELEADAAAAAETQQQEAIALAVLEHYTHVLRLQELIGLDEEQLERARWLDEQARVLFEAGRVLPAEREQAAIHLDELQMENRLRRDALAQARAALWLLIGLGESEGTTMELAAGALPDPETAGLPAPSGTNALAATPELRALDLQQRARELQVSAARAGRWPKVGAYVGYSHYGTKRFDNFDDELLVSMDFELPLFDGFRSRHAIAGASKEAEIARTKYHAMLGQKRIRVRDLQHRLRASAERPRLAQRRAALAQERLRLVDLNLQARRATLEEALAARAAYRGDVVAAVDAGFDRVLLWATLQREMGALCTVIRGEFQPSVP